MPPNPFDGHPSGVRISIKNLPDGGYRIEVRPPRGEASKATLQTGPAERLTAGDRRVLACATAESIPVKALAARAKRKLNSRFYALVKKLVDGGHLVRTKEGVRLP